MKALSSASSDSNDRMVIGKLRLKGHSQRASKRKIGYISKNLKDKECRKNVQNEIRSKASNKKQLTNNKTSWIDLKNSLHVIA